MFGLMRISLFSLSSSVHLLNVTNRCQPCQTGIRPV
jgi:hypothetical protein